MAARRSIGVGQVLAATAQAVVGKLDSEHPGEKLCIPTQYSDRREELERTLTPLTNPRTARRKHEPA
jgi:hypothetical protein